jgi:hypothetical protein
MPNGYEVGITGKIKVTCVFLEKEMPLLVSVSFFEMLLEFLGSATCSL